MFQPTFLPRKNPDKARSQGFTLIEMMIVVAIIGILSTIAYPSYQKYVLQSRRVDAKNALLDYAARQERYFSVHNSYATLLKDLGYGDTAASTLDINASGQVFYKLTIPDGGVTSTSFTATAVPTGAQVKDTECGTYQITQTGARTVTGTGSKCW